MSRRPAQDHRIRLHGALVLLVALSGIVPACTGSPTQPVAHFNEHEWIELTRTVTGVRGVVLAMPGTLRIEPGAEQTLTMFGDRAVLPAIETRVRGGTLDIRLAPGAIPHPGAPTQFVLTAPGLESAEAQVTLAGRGSATLRVRDRLRVTLTGSGSVYYYGEPEIESSISGSGQLVPMGG